MAQVLISDAALADLEALPLSVQERVGAIIERLEHWPNVSGIKRLTGAWKNHARVRTGDYRVIFTTTNEVVKVVRIAHRREVYD